MYAARINNVLLTPVYEKIRVNIGVRQSTYERVAARSDTVV